MTKLEKDLLACLKEAIDQGSHVMEDKIIARSTVLILAAEKEAVKTHMLGIGGSVTPCGRKQPCRYALLWRDVTCKDCRKTRRVCSVKEKA